MWKELWEASGANMENQSDWTEDQKSIMNNGWMHKVILMI